MRNVPIALAVAHPADSEVGRYGWEARLSEKSGDDRNIITAVTRQGAVAAVDPPACGA